MIRSRIRNSLFLFCLFTGVSAFSQDTDLFSEKNISEYARFLFNSSQFGYAAEEYERLIFVDNKNESYQLGLLKSYRFAEEYEKGIKAYDLLKTADYTPGYELVKEYSKLNILNGTEGNLDPLFLDPVLDHGFRNNLELTMRLIAFPESTVSLDGLDETVLSRDLIDLYNESFTLKYKSRLIAGSLSTLVPGLGKVYTGRWKDGLISLLFVAGTGYQAYRAFSDKGVNSVYGWIMGSISLGFYIGNIYGSAKSARLYNVNQNMNYREKVIDHYISHY
jgi:hypothetical protein